MKLIQTSQDDSVATEVGGKAAALARLASADLPIPPWFAVTTHAFTQSLTDAQVEAFSRGEDLTNLVAHLRVAQHVIESINTAVSALPGAGLLAVRSSAVDEDGSDHSFAGQLESFLFVPPERVIDRVLDVWRSGFSERVIAYRNEHRLTRAPTAPAVLVQRMIDADVSGVAFAVDPIGGSRSTVVVSAVFGLGTALVGGEAEADTYRLRHSGEVIEQHIAQKSFRHVMDVTAPQGVRSEPLPDEQTRQATLTVARLRQVSNLVLAASRFENRPQDIEWAFHDDQLYLLQSRPITSLASVADADGVRTIWDNSNIAESYNGVTTPLTFTFAQRAYEGAYRQFCRMMKVPAKVIADNDAMFGQMLGLLRGRVYYNLINWYRLLAMLPGFSVNQTFMEQMMGVREGLPPEIASGLVARTWSQRQSDRLRLAWSAGGLAWNHFVLSRKIKAFYARLDEAMAPPNPPLQQMRLDQLTAEFQKLESKLVSRWDAPLINDFLAMIFFGVLGKLTKTWCNDAGGNLQNDLIGDEGGIISIEPVKRISEMASLVLNDVDLIDALCNADPRAVVPRILTIPALATAYRSYLDKFGDRCLEELKLESATLTDDPTPLLRTVGETARRMKMSPTGAPKPFHPRKDAEATVAAALKGRALRRVVFSWVLRNARARVRDRENLRFERTRLFGRVRRIFIEVGRRMVSEGLLRHERDIFYLTLNDVLGFVEGTGCDQNLSALAQRRIEEFKRFRTGPAPADRCETRGAVFLGNTFTSSAVSSNLPDTTGVLKGTGCCPGVVRGRVRVIHEPRGAHLRQGEILVAERTDPGWIMLFPAAAGVLVERGSLLSHSAIVARELGIPAIVSIPNLLRTLQDGQLVEMNGSTGTILLIDTPAVELKPS